MANNKTNPKITMMAKAVLNMNLIPPIPKEANIVIKNLQQDVSKLLISMLGMYREKLKEISPDIYEIVMRITIHLAVVYETNEKFRNDFDNLVEPIIMNYAEQRLKKEKKP